MENIAGSPIISSLEKQFEAFEKSLNGASKSPVHQLRKQAIDVLKNTGLPGPKNEEYKFTNLTRALTRTFDFDTETSSFALVNEQIEDLKIRKLDAYQFVFLNGQFSPTLSDKIETEEVTVLPFSDAIKRKEAQFQKYFGKKADFQNDAFIAMNTAFSMNGIYIEIADHVTLDKPIILYFVGDSTKSQLTYQIRNLVITGKSSRATIIEKFDTIGSHKSFSNVVNEFVVAENAHIQYFKLENDTEHTYHISNTVVTQENHSNFTANTIVLNGAMVRNNLNIILDGQGCEANMNGLYVLDGKSHVDNHTVVDHQQPNSNSNELYKGIMDGQSKGVFNGKIFVRQDAQHTNAFQSNKNVLLSDNATVNTKPQLEIWADDVKCSHGCTTGQLDEDALFYLQARGITKAKAKAMLLHAFASDVLEKIGNKAVIDHVETIITERLEK